MVLHAVRTEPPLEQIDNAAVLELTRLSLKQIVGEGEEPETRIAELAQARRSASGSLPSRTAANTRRALLRASSAVILP